eukprot:gnl/TRDRNA2_/TRDRNA2_181752_c0_seq1.p1 gnl/TRDRNA2_/TRDRNA2_181752_c0~~gnl/TRDRNA2_/TRDRNA2_181752_c0_seq1.p1  ORF type:complete len:515 (-),score=154.96 gnl/TRDRNA2_/TRDRNA2_181752_c0_seq1:40-1500(-)
MADDPAPPTVDRVVTLLKQLDGDKTLLQQETEALRAERAKWVPRPQEAATAPVPEVCATKLNEAAAHERRSREAARRAERADAEAAKRRAQRSQAEDAAEAAVRAAEERRQDAERRLAAAQAAITAADAQHRRYHIDSEAERATELKAVGQAVDAVRASAETRAQDALRRIADRRASAVREIAEVQAEGERQRAEIERKVKEHEAACAAAVTAADKRREEAEAAAKQAWQECEVKIEESHTEAEDRVAEAVRVRGKVVEGANEALAKIEREFEEQLSEVSAREQDIRRDVAAEARAEEAKSKSAEAVRVRRLACDAVAAKSEGELKAIMLEAQQSADAAAARIREVQAHADTEVEEIRLKLEAFARNSHEGQINRSHSWLVEASESMRKQLSARLERFEEEAKLQSHQAVEALVHADRHIEELRANAVQKAGQQVGKAERSLVALEEESKRNKAEADKKLRHTQDQMVQYVEKQQEDLIACLEASK